MKNYKQYINLDKNTVIEKINSFLEEDLPNGDITTDATIADNTIANANIIGMEEMIFSGKQVIHYCFDESDVEININDGDRVLPNTIIGTIKGNAKSILSRERVMLNIIQRLCGIATHTNS